ncbi:PAS domain-containing protein [Methylobacterium sp. JK268]
MSDLDFDRPDLARAVEGLGPDGIDALPFGVIRLDRQGIVCLYNATERAQSGSGAHPRLGRHFFSEVAPCMDDDRFRGRIERARAAGTLDLEFTHVGDFSDRERELTVRIQSSHDGGVWIFLRREG